MSDAARTTQAPLLATVRSALHAGPRRAMVLAAGLAAALIVALLTAVPAHADTLNGVWHDPYGDDELYASQPTERSPRDPMAGENVTVRATTWPIASGQSVWVTWSVNGVAQTPRGASYDYNAGNNTYWKVDLGSFSRGDDVQYTDPRRRERWRAARHRPLLVRDHLVEHRDRRDRRDRQRHVGRHRHG
ncbi:hypothetical protein QE374_000663 [Microbacterium sp. SORGH_AS428]|uniref:hypothetical protein n=1 Tax=Microbacterium sp. SORGH_AS_0428 TaxID=3041788 RepID=UPI00285DA9DD|nr:hypothetical protein [Microbacterium sp. SORGH_AS_0428]MDR6198754.1 hypothetical protein [Microbacterium sp. SORGH_AS_0428]